MIAVHTVVAFCLNGAVSPELPLSTPPVSRLSSCMSQPTLLLSGEDALVVPRHLEFTFCHQPRGTPGKSYNARTVLRLGSPEYKLLMLDITQLSIASELDMERPLGMQNMAQVSEVRRRALELYPGLEIFDPYSWPVDMLLRLILKTSSDKAARAARVAYQAECTLAARWAKILVGSLSRVIPPPMFPIIFDLVSLPCSSAGFLLEALLGIPLALWPVVSLATLYQLPSASSSSLVLLSVPRFMLLLPLIRTQPRTLMVKVVPSNCPFLTRKNWILRMTIKVAVEGEIAVKEREAEAKVEWVGARLAIMQAVPLWCELVDRYTDDGSANGKSTDFE